MSTIQRFHCSNFVWNCFPRLRKQYEFITDKALTTPTNTQHLMELKEYMDKAEENQLPILEKKMVESKLR